MQRQEKMSRTIADKLHDEMRNGQFKNQLMLPPETELATMLGISRTQLRDGLAILEQNGFITRRRGIGSTINRHVMEAVTRVDLEVEFLDLVRDAGFAPEGKLLKVEVSTDDEDAAKRLNVASHTPILEVTRLIYADQKPFILCTDHISFERIKNYHYTLDDLIPPIFYFVEKFCQTEIFMNLTDIKPILADAELAELLHVNKGEPLLRFDEVAYNIDNEIILYSKESYVDGILTHKVLRKKI